MTRNPSNGIGLMVTLVMMLILLAGVVSAAPVPCSEKLRFGSWEITDEPGIRPVRSCPKTPLNTRCRSRFGYVELCESMVATVDLNYRRPAS